MHDVAKMLLLFRSLKDNTIKPVVKNFGVVYEVEGIELSEEQLSELEKSGLIIPSGYEYYPSCSICNSTALATMILCPSCKNSTLEKNDLLVHYNCNSIFPLKDVIVKDGVYICPKCSKHFSRIGIDYGRPGYGFKCFKCNTITQFPLIGIVCINGHISNPYDLNIEKVTCYKLSNEAREFVKIYEDLLHARDRLVKAYDRIQVDLLCKVKGLSNVEHTVALYIKYNNMVIAVDYITNANANANANAMDWFKVITKAMDIPSSFIILTPDKGIEGNILMLLSRYNIRLVMLDGIGIVDAILREVGGIVCRV